jgi:hypothetical protein
MEVIVFLSIVLCGYICGMATALIIHFVGEFIEERRARKEEKEKEAVEKEAAAFKGLADCQYRTMAEQVEELTLRLKVEEEAHKFWRNKWAELNNNKQGDNE